MSSDDQKKGNHHQRAYNLTIAAVVSQVGCLTIIIIVIGLIGGFWLDAHFNTKPVFTIGLLVVSIPVTLILMLWLVRKATNSMQFPERIKDNKTEKPAQED